MTRSIYKVINNFTDWNARNGLNLLRWSLGIIFFWFGFLKFFPGLSPAEEIAAKTINTLSGGWLTPSVSLPLLGTLECLIGVGFFLNKYLTVTVILLYFQMIGACLPLFIFRNETWSDHFLIPTLLGQYIIKNCVLISAGIVIGATIKGGGLISNPAAVKVFDEKEVSKEMGITKT
jgi:uncharacterized membrane protein YkgB